MKRAVVVPAVALPAILAAVIMGALSGCSHSPAGPSGDLAPPAEYARDLFDGVNAERDQAGLAALAWNDCLEQKARPRAEAAAAEDSLEHEPLFATCIPDVASGENLSKGAFAPEQIVAKWMASAGHAANILKPDFTDAAVACVAVGEASAGYACSLLFEGGA